MKRFLYPNASVLGLYMLLVTAPLALGRPAGGGTPVTVTFADAAGDRVRSDGLGSYIGEIRSGYFHLFLDKATRQTDRSLTMDFTDCELDCTAPITNTVVLGTGVQANTHNGAVDEIPVGSTVSLRFVIKFTDPQSGQRWAVQYFGDTQTCGTEQPSGMVNVTRDGDTQWTMVAPAGTVGCLLKVTTSKGRTIATPNGRFRMPLSLTFVK